MTLMFALPHLLLAVFPVLRTVICLDPSEHLSPAAFWSCIPVPGEILGLAGKRALGNSLLKVEFKAASVWGGGVLLPWDHFGSHLIWDFFGHQSLVQEGQVECVSLIPGL